MRSITISLPIVSPLAACLCTSSSLGARRQQQQLQLQQSRRCGLLQLRPGVAAKAVQQSSSTITTPAPLPAAAAQATTSSSSASSQSLWSRLHWELLLLAAAAPPLPPALADDGLRYDASRGEGLVKTLSGAGYIALLLYFLFRVLGRRARKAREERLAGQGPVTTIFTKLIEKVTQGKPQPKATPGAAFFGALQAGAIAAGLFVFSTKVEGLVYGQDLPPGYTARNIAITVRTILVGLLYLATFTFSANAVGLTGLGVQLLIWPDSLPDEAPPVNQGPRTPALPAIKVTSSPTEVRKAFRAVAAQADAAAAGAGASNSGAAVGSSTDGGGSGQAPAAAAAAGSGGSSGSSSEEA